MFQRIVYFLIIAQTLHARGFSLCVGLPLQVSPGLPEPMEACNGMRWTYGHSACERVSLRASARFLLRNGWMTFVGTSTSHHFTHAHTHTHFPLPFIRQNVIKTMSCLSVLSSDHFTIHLRMCVCLSVCVPACACGVVGETDCKTRMYSQCSHM